MNFYPLRSGRYSVSVDDGINPLHFAGGAGDTGIDLFSGGDQTVMIVVDCSMVLEGMVVDESGHPVPDAWVTASSNAATTSARNLSSPLPPRILSDIDGSFAFRGLCPDARYRVRSQRPDGGTGQVENASPGQFIEVTTYTHGHLSGLVTDENHRPVQAYVLILTHSNPRHDRSLQINQSEGRFEISDVPPGVVTLTAQTIDRKMGSTKVEIGPGDTLLEVELTVALLPSKQSVDL